MGRRRSELFGPLLLTEELLATPLRYEDFSLVVPEGPGLGVTLDEETIAFHRVDRPERRTVVVVEAV